MTTHTAVGAHPWREVPDPDDTRPLAATRVVALGLPLVITACAAALLLRRGEAAVAFVLVLGVSGLTQARLLSPRVEQWSARQLVRFTHAVAAALRLVLLGVVFAVCFVPAAVVSAAFGRGSLGRPVGTGDGWTAAGPKTATSAHRGFGAEPPRPVHGSRLATAALVLVALVTVDILAGAALTATGTVPPIDRGDIFRTEHLRVVDDLDHPAWKDEPWAAEMMEDLIPFQSERYDLQPYIQSTTYAYESRYLNTTDTERVSFQADRPPATRPLRVAFLGGSVMFGIGQRDEHTIPSEVARLADAAGVPIEVHNYGFPRWVAWQEFLYLERLFARGERYDLVVFLDGFNEFYMQGEGYSVDPTHHAATALADIVADFRSLRAEEADPVDGVRELAEAYRRTSGFWRVTDHLMGRQAAVPGAGAVTATPTEVIAAAMDIYRRAKGVITDLGARHQAPVRFFWQPQASGWPSEVIEQLPPDVVDVTHVFDGREGELYFDPVHTNEEGARLLASAIWEHIGPELTAMAETSAEGPPTVRAPASS